MGNLITCPNCGGTFGVERLQRLRSVKDASEEHIYSLDRSTRFYCHDCGEEFTDTSTDEYAAVNEMALAVKTWT